MVEIETTVRQWFPRLITGRPHQVIFNNDNPQPYLLRWYIIPRNRLFNVYLHKFLRSDDDRALHDHPWPFVSMILNRPYLEYTAVSPNPHVRKRFSIAYRPAHWRHRVDLQWANIDGKYVQPPVWTVVITGRKRRTWGFWCPGVGETKWSEYTRFIRWQDWVESRGCAEN